MAQTRNRIVDTGITLVATAFVTLVVLSTFLLQKRTLIWGYDGTLQHYQSLYFFNDWVRGIARHPNLGVPQWSWHIGLGADIIGSLSFYVVGDPFALISLAFPMSHLVLAYQVALIIRILAAGMFAGLYMRHMGAKNVPAIMGALVYTFCGFMLANGLRDPFFVNAMVFLPLLLLAIERALRTRRPWCLTAVVFVAAASNFYFFYILTIVTILYAIARHLETVEPTLRWRRLLPVGARIAGFYALGAMLAGPILLPTLSAIRDSARGQASYSFGWLYSAVDYRAILGDLASVRVDAFHSFMGFAFAGLMLVPVLYARPGRRALKFMIAAYVPFLALPAFGSMFNGFTFPLDRFAFTLGIFVGLAGALVLSDARPFDRRDVLAMVLGYLAFVALLLIVHEPLDSPLTVALLLGLATIAVCAVSAWRGSHWASGDKMPASGGRWKAPLVQWVLLSLVVLNVAANAVLLYSVAGFARGFVSSGELQRLNDSTSVLSGKVGQGRGFRVDDRNPADDNFSMSHGYSGTSLYLSVVNGGLSRLRSELGLGTLRLPSISIEGFDDRVIPDSLVSAEYYVTNSWRSGLAPFGYTLAKRWGKAVAYRSSDVLPLGFVYRSAIRRSVYDGLSALDKQSALLQGAVIDDAAARSVPRLAPTSEAIDVTYTAVPTDGATLNSAGNAIVSGVADASLTLRFHPVPASELYVELNDFRDVSAGISSTGTPYLDTVYAAADHIKPQTWLTTASPYAWGPALQVVNLGYFKSGAASLTMKIREPGTLRFGSLKVLALPMREFPARVERLRNSGMRNITISTNGVSGTASSAGPGLLFLSIPYSSGWSAKVDGSPTPIVRADTAFSGIPISSGTHSISLHYQTPWLDWGVALAGLAGIVILLVLLVDAAGHRGSSRLESETDGR